MRSNETTLEVGDTVRETGGTVADPAMKGRIIEILEGGRRLKIEWENGRTTTDFANYVEPIA